MRRFAQSVPLSDPQEQAALASQRGLLGEQQRNDAGNLAAQYNTFAQGNNGAGDFLQNLSNQQQGQQSALYGSAMQGALQRRFEAQGQAANIAQGAVGAASQYQQQPSLAAGFGDLARLIAYNQTMKANQPKQPPAGGNPGSETTPNPGVGPSGTVDVPAGDQYPGPNIPMPGDIVSPKHPGQFGTMAAGPPYEAPMGSSGQPAYGSLSPSELLLRATGRY